ncbi:uncharacterized protein ACLA_093190 [Aspergillus clavatus NRRL 1]|uniref:Uncharacterized protein n=1 Tax=Aspergillus clavatus (strain ATCC 1007 / CBS 513.65 / DSM 816 / NCTC 3887 / NRRL 1 / QM 1276 / 107) TaxID=344612 RepID=A1CFH1_ASPCL|nr:uncharacterized protein ACLA_093190 [Aspergillus clavatus NRRL 1]EAW11620.1 conserved hypothetical protein [Aspergillus clavatus NRRL 1]
MAAESSMYQMDYSVRSDEWLDFDNTFEFPTGYLESNPPSLESISPKDLELVYSDADALNWDMDAAQFSQPAFSDLLTFEEPLIGATDMPLNMIDSNTNLLEPSNSGFDDSWSSFAPLDTTESFYSPSLFRQTVESRAAADPRCFSKKEKRLEASISLHLQRLQDAAVADMSQTSDSCDDFSPCWPDSVAGSSQSRGSPSTTSTSDPPSKSSSPPSSAPSSAGGGMELVLDLNMNATTNLPKKQKPRSQAQKENYIKVRKHGACEKHRKQHKRCNCLEKTVSRALNDSAIAALGQPTKARLEVRNTGQNFFIATRPAITSATPVLQPTAVDRTRAVKAVPGSLQSKVAVSPTETTNAQHTERSTYSSGGFANTAHVHLQVRQTHKEARPSRAAIQTHAVPGSLVTQPTHTPTVTVTPTTRQPGTLRAVQCTAGVLHESGVLRPFRIRSTTQQDVGSRSETQTQTNKHSRGKESSYIDSGTRYSGAQPKVGQHPVLPQSADIPVRRSVAQSVALLESARTAVLDTALAFSAFWQSSTSLTSWAGTLLGRLVLSSSRQHRLFRKGMGLA